MDPSVEMGIHGGLAPSKLPTVSSLNTKSFKNALLGDISLRSPLVSIIHSLIKGSPMILISYEDMDKLVEPFVLSFIGSFYIVGQTWIVSRISFTL